MQIMQNFFLSQSPEKKDIINLRGMIDLYLGPRGFP